MQTLVQPMAQQPNAQRNCLNVSIVNPVIRSTIHIFKEMVRDPLYAGKPFVSQSEHPLAVDVSAVMGFTGKNIAGSIVICFPEQVFLGVMSSMLGDEIREIDDEVRDGACELLNIIYGNARTEWNKTNSLGLDISIPNLIANDSVQVESLIPKPPIILPFHCESGIFYMYMGMVKLTDDLPPSKSFCITEFKRRYV